MQPNELIYVCPIALAEPHSTIAAPSLAISTTKFRSYNPVLTSVSQRTSGLHTYLLQVFLMIMQEHLRVLLSV